MGNRKRGSQTCLVTSNCTSPAVTNVTAERVAGGRTKRSVAAPQLVTVSALGRPVSGPVSLRRALTPNHPPGLDLRVDLAPYSVSHLSGGRSRKEVSDTVKSSEANTC